MNFQIELEKKVSEIETIIQSFLPKEEGFAATMAQAMNYSMRAGGKRLRPLFLMETCRLFHGEERLAAPFAAAIDIPNFIVFIIADFTIFFKGFSVERIVSFRPVFLCTLYII